MFSVIMFKLKSVNKTKHTTETTTTHDNVQLTEHRIADSSKLIVMQDIYEHFNVI